MTETDGRLWPMGGLPRVYGSFVDVVDPGFESLRAGLEIVQGDIDRCGDQIDMKTLATMVNTKYDPIRQALIIRLSWTARGKEEQSC